MRWFYAVLLLGGASSGCALITGLDDMIHDVPEGAGGSTGGTGGVGGVSEPLPCGVLWAQAFTTTDYVGAYAVATDDAGVYVAGEFYTDVVLGAETTPGAGDDDVFVARLDATTGETTWIRAFGDDSAQGAYDIALGPSNTVVIGGWTTGQVAGCNTNDHAFIAAIGRDDPSDTTCFAFSGTDPDPLNTYTPSSEVHRVAMTPDGNLWVLGKFVEALDYQTGELAGYGTFLTKHDGTTLDPKGAWSYADGDPMVEEQRSLALAADDSHVSVAIATNAFTGDFFGMPLGNDPGGDGFNVVLAQLDAGGAGLWALAIGGDNDQDPGGIALDSAGDPVIAGTVDYQIDLGDGVGSQGIDTSISEGAIFSTRYTDGAPVWSPSLRLDAPTTYDEASDVVTDAEGNVYITGLIGPDHGEKITDGCPTGSTELQAFVAKVAPDMQLRWLRSFAAPTNGTSEGWGLTLSPDGAWLAVVGGFSGELDVGPTTLTSDPEIGGSFVVVMSTSDDAP